MSRRATHLLYPENIRTVKNIREHQNSKKNIKEAQWRPSENITPTTVRIFKLSPVETKSQNKNLYINKKLNITKIRKKSNETDKDDITKTKRWSSDEESRSNEVTRWSSDEESRSNEVTRWSSDVVSRRDIETWKIEYF